MTKRKIYLHAMRFINTQPKEENKKDNSYKRKTYQRSEN